MLALDLPPQIVTQPSSQLGSPGGNVTFHVVATGTPTLRYQWQLNNGNLMNATNSALTLTNLQITNNGNYRVVVSNAYGHAMSTGASPLVVNFATTVVPNLG